MRWFKRFRHDRAAANPKPPRTWSFLAETLAAEQAGQRRRSSANNSSTGRSFDLSATLRLSATSVAASPPPTDGAALSHDIESPPDDKPVPWSDLERIAWADGRRRCSSTLVTEALPKSQGSDCYHLFGEDRSSPDGGQSKVEAVRRDDGLINDRQIENEADLPLWRQRALRRWSVIRRAVRDGTYRHPRKKLPGRPRENAGETTYWRLGCLPRACLTSLERVGFFTFLKTCRDSCWATWEERSLRHTVVKTALLLVFFMAAGSAMYCSFEGWTTVESLYFITSTFTTVGFGDIHPTLNATKVFTIFYSVAGVFIIGQIVGNGISRLMHSQIEKLEAVKRMNDESVMDAFDNGEPDKTRRGVEKSGGDDHREVERDALISSFKSRALPKWHRSSSNLGHVPQSQCKTARHIFAGLVRFFFSIWERMGPLSLWFIMQLAGAVFFMLQEGWSAIDSLYWTVVTSTTIGYGDQVPSTGTRIFCIFFIPLLVFFTADVLASLAQSMLNRDVEKAKDELFRSRLLLEEDLTAMDTDGDGVVTRLEYFEFMLLAMGRVDKLTLERLHEMFDKLDADGSGTLEPDDLMLITKRKGVLERTARKMKMEEYRSMLIAKGSMRKERRTDPFKVLVMSSTLRNLKRNSLLARIAQVDD